MKKYYGYFIYDDEEYVIRFKIDGSLTYRRDYPWFGCFVDKEGYVKSAWELIGYAALDGHPSNDKRFGSFSLLLDHQRFVEERANGIKRWIPKREVILWD